MSEDRHDCKNYVGDPVEDQTCPDCGITYVFHTSDLINSEKNEAITEIDWDCMFCGFEGIMTFKLLQ